MFERLRPRCQKSNPGLFVKGGVEMQKRVVPAIERTIKPFQFCWMRKYTIYIGSPIGGGHGAARTCIDFSETWRIILASDAANMVTGAEYEVTGGDSAKDI